MPVHVPNDATVRRAVQEYRDVFGAPKARALVEKHLGPRAKLASIERASDEQKIKLHREAVSEVEHEQTFGKPMTAPTAVSGRYDPKSDADRHFALLGAMADFQKISTKSFRWGLESVEPRPDRPHFEKTNRQIMLTQLDVIRSWIDLVETDLTRDQLGVNIGQAAELEHALAHLKSAKGVQTVLAVMREIGGSENAATILASPEKANAVIERCAALIAHHAPAPAAAPFDDEDGLDG